ncbi:hypothetical protein C8R47DRAFT_1245209 [Mycena vitilis]|nr:hypothetical protein C8R47DRAFT_1245209 [Mycena vitilis]
MSQMNGPSRWPQESAQEAHSRENPLKGSRYMPLEHLEEREQHLKDGSMWLFQHTAGRGEQASDSGWRGRDTIRRETLREKSMGEESGNLSEKPTAYELREDWAVSAQSVEILCCAIAETRTVCPIAVVENSGTLRGPSAKVGQAAATEKQDGRDPIRTPRTTINGSESRDYKMEINPYGARAQLKDHKTCRRFAQAASENSCISNTFVVELTKGKFQPDSIPMPLADPLQRWSDAPVSEAVGTWFVDTC